MPEPTLLTSSTYSNAFFPVGSSCAKSCEKYPTSHSSETLMKPLLGLMIFASVFNKVDFPAPFFPHIKILLLRSISNVAFVAIGSIADSYPTHKSFAVMYIRVVFGGSAKRNDIPPETFLLFSPAFLSSSSIIAFASSLFIALASSAFPFASRKVSKATTSFFSLSFACFALVAFAPKVLMNVSNFFVSLEVLSTTFAASFAFAAFARKYCSYEPGYCTNF